MLLALGAMSKALATIATQPLIVAKVGLQSRPPPSRNGKPFKSFIEVMQYIIEHEGPWALFKGIGPQILKGLLVQGILMMTKERYVSSSGISQTTSTNPSTNCRMELTFIILFRYLRKIRAEKLQKYADMAADRAKKVADSAANKAKQAAPVLMK